MITKQLVVIDHSAMALPACPTGSWYDVFRVCCANERVSAASLIINLAASRCAAQAWAPCRWNLRHVLTSPLHFAAHAAHAAHAARAALAAHAALAARAHVALATHAARAGNIEAVLNMLLKVTVY